MPCEQCKAKGYDHDAVVAACKGSIYQTAVRLCRWDRIEGSIVHKALCDAIQKCYTDGPREVLLMIWRWGMKSTIVVSTIIWGLINNPELRVLMEHASADESKKKIKQLKVIIQSDVMRHFFPQIVPDPDKVIWRDDAIEVVRKGNYQEASVEARGVYSTVVGGHFNAIFRDDPIDENIARSVVKTQQTADHYDNSANLLDTDESRFEMTSGTLWEGSFYPHVEEKGLQSGEMKVIKFGCRVDDRYRKFMAGMGYKVTAPDGAPVFPKYCGEEWIRRKEHKLGPVKASRQLYLLPATDAETRFTKLYYYHAGIDGLDTIIVDVEELRLKKVLKTKDAQLVATVDPGGGESEKTDKSAIVIVAWYPNEGLGFCLEAWQRRVLPDQLINHIFTLNEKWRKYGEIWWGIERAGLQSYLYRWLKNEVVQRQRGLSLHMVRLGNRSKPDRANAIQPFVVNGQLFFLKNQREMIDALTHFQVINGRVVGGSPNLVDALGMQADRLRLSGDRGRPDDEDGENWDEEEEAYTRPTVIQRAYGLGVD